MKELCNLSKGKSTNAVEKLKEIHKKTKLDIIKFHKDTTYFNNDFISTSFRTDGIHSWKDYLHYHFRFFKDDFDCYSKDREHWVGQKEFFPKHYHTYLLWIFLRKQHVQF